MKRYKSPRTGLPVFMNDEVAFAAARLHRTQPINPRERRFQFDILDTPRFKDVSRTRGVEKAMETSKVGELMLVMRNDRFHALEVIQINEGLRGRGYGERAVRSMLYAQNEPVLIKDIQPKAVDFWKKMGAEFERSDEYMEARLDRFQYATYQQRRGRDGARSEGVGRNEPRREKGSHDEAAGGDETDSAES